MERRRTERKPQPVVLGAKYMPYQHLSVARLSEELGYKLTLLVDSFVRVTHAALPLFRYAKTVYWLENGDRQTRPAGLRPDQGKSRASQV